MTAIKEFRRLEDGSLVTGHVNRDGKFVDIRPARYGGGYIMWHHKSVQLALLAEKGVDLKSLPLETTILETVEEEGTIYVTKYSAVVLGETVIFEGEKLAWKITEEKKARDEAKYQEWLAKQTAIRDSFLPKLAELVKSSKGHERGWFRKFVERRKCVQQVYGLIREHLPTEFHTWQDENYSDLAKVDGQMATTIREAGGWTTK